MKVALQTFRLFLALVTIPFVKTQDCGVTLGDLDCCGDFCCADENALGCPLQTCAIATCGAAGGGGGGVTVGVACNYRTVTCTPIRPFIDCECGCRNDNDCDNSGVICPVCGNIVNGRGTCIAQPACPDFRPLDPVTCDCGCITAVNCVNLPGVDPLSCPSCTPDGLCVEKICGTNQPCCKATSGNDLVCASGCGQGNVCFQNEINKICDGTALCIASLFPINPNPPNEVEDCVAAAECLMEPTQTEKRNCINALNL